VKNPREYERHRRATVMFHQSQREIYSVHNNNKEERERERRKRKENPTNIRLRNMGSELITKNLLFKSARTTVTHTAISGTSASKIEQHGVRLVDGHL